MDLRRKQTDITTKDYKPTDRGKYVEAIFANLDGKACEARLPIK